MTIPAGPAELTEEWLTDALRIGGVVKDAAVSSHTASPLADAKGFYGQVVRVQLEYDREEAGAPRALIAKFASSNNEMRLRANRAYEREVRFYQEVSGRTPLPTAACYYAGLDVTTGRHVLLLEDLAPARSGSRVQGCTSAQAALALRKIARFHAYWWESPQLTALDWLEADAAEPDAEGQRQMFEGWWLGFLHRAGDRVPERVRAMGEPLGMQRAAIRRRVFGSPPRTLIHRDYQLDNLVFGAPGGGKPFAVLDWQMVSRGRATWDAAYFLSENLRTEVRRATGMDLLRLYWRELAAYGVEGYSFEDCLMDFSYCLLQRLGALVSTIAAMPFSEEQLRLHVDVLLPRTLAAIEDAHAFDLLQ